MARTVGREVPVPAEMVMLAVDRVVAGNAHMPRFPSRRLQLVVILGDEPEDDRCGFPRLLGCVDSLVIDDAGRIE